MKKFFSLMWLLLAVSCNTSQDYEAVKEWMQPNGKIKVLSTTAMINNLVQEVAKEHADTLTLIRGDLDPHSYQLVKGDDEKLQTADIIFANGLGLEHGASLQHHLHSSSKTVFLGDLIFKNNPNLIIYFNGQLDPHIWMDISLWSNAVRFIVSELSAKDPEHAEEFARNGEKLQELMLLQHQAVKDILHEVPERKRYLVTSHDAFNYFTKAYLAENGESKGDLWQKRFAAPEGLAPDSQLNPYDIQMIIDHLQKYKIRVLFPESNVSRDSIRKIVAAGKEKGLDVTIATDYLYGDAMGKPGSDGDTYLKMIMHNARTISQHLNKNP